ncbi:MAG: DNA-processing protein DprA, partial [Promethearchaeota archaeon]
PSKGLIKLFEDQKININTIRTLDKDILIKLLFSKGQVTINEYNTLINKLYNPEYNLDKDYKSIENIVNYCLKNNIKIYTANSRDIPSLFYGIPANNRDLVFIMGNIIEDDIKSYSICGTRTPTKDAIDKTKLISKFFAQNKFTLINGFARGIDIEAYLGTVSEKGRYIGVLASGLRNIYPPENRKYVINIIDNGALISQRLPFKRVTKQALQMRNRLSAQLSLGSIFIEGTYQSGTKWQFKFAREAKKKIFYLEPENWNHPNSYIPKMVKNAGGIKIKKDLSNLNDILDILNDEYQNRRKKIIELFNN